MKQLYGKTRSWRQKFRDAFRGVGIAAVGQSSFRVHLICTLLVLIVGVVVHLDTWQWCAVLICIAMVLVAEAFNTAIEVLAKAIDTSFHPQIRDALDVASGAVLLASSGAVVVGVIVLLDAL